MRASPRVALDRARVNVHVGNWVAIASSLVAARAVVTDQLVCARAGLHDFEVTTLVDLYALEHARGEREAVIVHR